MRTGSVTVPGAATKIVMVTSSKELMKASAQPLARPGTISGSVMRFSTVASEAPSDTAFGEVLEACGGDREGVWLTPRLMRGYEALFELGIAHSVEAWDGDRLVGGLFGVVLARYMTAESMFHAAPDGGNAAIAGLLHIARANDITLIDVQMQSPHVMRFGATLMRTLAPLQLTLAMLAAALTGVVAVSTEKDRRTLELLLVSRLTDRELVLGKLAASLVRVSTNSSCAIATPRTAKNPTSSQPSDERRSAPAQAPADGRVLKRSQQVSAGSIGR